MGRWQVRVAPAGRWSRMFVLPVTTGGVLAYGCTKIFVLQPAVGALLLGMIAVATARATAWPGVALAVGVIATIWNDLVGLPHALAGFLFPAILIELWVAHWRARPCAAARNILAIDLALLVLTLGSPVAIGFLAGPGYIYLDEVLEFRHYLIDLKSIGLAYLGVIGAIPVLVAGWIHECHRQHRRRKAHTEQLTARSGEIAR